MSNTLAAVVVLYQLNISQTPNYDLLKNSITNTNFTLLVYDNSPKAHEDQLFTYQNVHYFHDATNSGLAKAYNQALQYCQIHQVDLLLLLDQDTQLPVDYLQRLLQKKLTDEVAVFVPLVKAQGQQISPVYRAGYVNTASKKPAPGVYCGDLMAINSGTVLTLATMEWLGSFQEEFPLDFLDHWFFYQLNQAQKKIEVFNTVIYQELSVLDYRFISLNRYESIIRSESLFYKKYDTEMFSQHRKHLLLRTVKQIFLVKNRKIWKRTLREFLVLMKGK